LLLGENIEVAVLATEVARSRLAIQAPWDVTILRSERRIRSFTATGQRRFTVLSAAGLRTTHRA